MTGTKIALLGAIGTSLLPVGQLANPATMSMIEAVKAGGVATLLIVFLVYFVREGKERQLRLEALMDEHNKAAVAQAAAGARQAAATEVANRILEDMRVTVEKCKGGNQ